MVIGAHIAKGERDARSKNQTGSGIAVCDESRLYRVREFADIVDVNYMTAWRWVRGGEIAATRVGGQLRIAGREINRYLKSRELIPA